MQHNPDSPPRVWWKPADDASPNCLVIDTGTPGEKRYRRIWAPGTTRELLGWCEHVPENAVPLMVPEDADA